MPEGSDYRRLLLFLWIFANCCSHLGQFVQADHCIKNRFVFELQMAFETSWTFREMNFVFASKDSALCIAFLFLVLGAVILVLCSSFFCSPSSPSATLHLTDLQALQNADQQGKIRSSLTASREWTATRRQECCKILGFLSQLHPNQREETIRPRQAHRIYKPLKAEDILHHFIAIVKRLKYTSTTPRVFLLSVLSWFYRNFIH